MKKLFASAFYSFNNFYDNLNARGQIVFMVIIILIAILLMILFISYVMQTFKNKRLLKKVLKHNEIATQKRMNDTLEVKQETKEINQIIDEGINDNTEISDIASEIEKALNEERSVNLTQFEEDQERTAIISIDELIKKAKELEIIEDEETGVNYMEKYNLEPAEVNETIENINDNQKESAPIKSFKVSQVISPVYGVKKEVINNDRF